MGVAPGKVHRDTARHDPHAARERGLGPTAWQLARDLINSKPQLTTLRLVSFPGQTDTLSLAPNCKFLFPAEAPLNFPEYILGPKLKCPLRHRDRVTIHGPAFTLKGVEHLRSLPFLPNAYAVEARIFKRGANLSPRNDLGNESSDPVCL